MTLSDAWATDKRAHRPRYMSNRGEQALGILQSEIVRVAYKVRTARRVGYAELERTHKAQLFALLEVRRAMRAAKIWQAGNAAWDVAA